MKVKFDHDEWYPIFTPLKEGQLNGESVHELSEEEYQEYLILFERFNAWTDKLNKQRYNDVP